MPKANSPKDIRFSKYSWRVPAKVRDRILNKRLELTKKHYEGGLEDFESGYLECLFDISQILNDTCERRLDAKNK